MNDKLKKLVKAALEEASATGTGASTTPGQGIGLSTKYGFKKVNAKKMHRDAKAIDHKELWKKHLNEDNSIDDYLSSLALDDKKLEKHIAGRIADFNEVESKLNELIPLLTTAKQDTLNTYKANPSYDIKYSTSTAIEYLDDLIELFQPK
jgi:hypothetical protein